MRSVSRLSPLKSLIAKQSDKSLQDELDGLVDVLKQVLSASRISLSEAQSCDAEFLHGCFRV